MSASTRAGIEIQITGLHKAFEDRKVLRGIDLEIRCGDVLAIVGGSGSGKTVLLDHILSRMIPDSGRIRVVNHGAARKALVDLRKIGDLELDDIHRHWGVVFQRNALFSGTVLFNIALWLREVKLLDEAEVLPVARASLRAVGLPETDEFLAQPQESLSGGMAKRLALARALAMDPMVVFYDEPTTGLDPVTAGQIHDLIYTTHHRLACRTSVIVTHDKDLLKRLRPRTVMLHEGKVHFDGTFEKFERSRSPIIRPYFDTMPVLQDRAVETWCANPAERRRGLLA
ncbi:MAG TPA: ATP-binding cassette domain-containing protein [Gammaproteobacteria bacterium]|jgi:phospholipid/cholesterol/gamma-HCH transport system ATP-binding protein